MGLFERYIKHEYYDVNWVSLLGFCSKVAQYCFFWARGRSYNAGLSRRRPFQELDRWTS